jgi:hypothetical protein
VSSVLFLLLLLLFACCLLAHRQPCCSLHNRNERKEIAKMREGIHSVRTVRSSLLITHHSLLTAYCLLITHCALLTHWTFSLIRSCYFNRMYDLRKARSEQRTAWLLSNDYQLKIVCTIRLQLAAFCFRLPLTAHETPHSWCPSSSAHGLPW